MSEDNTWPGKPGVPMNPERDGWHWVDDGANGTEPRFWSATFAGWDGYPLWMAKEWDYLRPCSPDDLTPAEVDARVSEARRDALKKLERHFKEAAAGTPLGHENRQRGASTYNWLIYCASIISALGEKE